MIRFKEIELSDKNWYDSIVKDDIGCSAFYNFGNLYMWDIPYKYQLALIDKRVAIKFNTHGNTAFYFPIGTGDLEQAVLQIKEYSDCQGIPLVFSSVEENHVEHLKIAFPGKFIYEPDEANYEYIYLAEKLSTYSGKALHSKKNHCNNFEKSYPGWKFLPITNDNIPECSEMLREWYNINKERLDDSAVDEESVFARTFADYSALGLEGGMLIHEGKVLGFSIGELNSGKCFDCHFEKADININGAYPMVCREMTKLVIKNHPEIVYMNREEDMGIEALRKSKQSYKPEFILKKYNARWLYE